MKAIIAGSGLSELVIKYLGEVVQDLTVISDIAENELRVISKNIKYLRVNSRDRLDAVSELREYDDVVKHQYDLCVASVDDPVGSSVPSAVTALGGGCKASILFFDPENVGGGRYWLPALREMSYSTVSRSRILYVAGRRFLDIGKLVAVLATYATLPRMLAPITPPFVTFMIKRVKLVKSIKEAIPMIEAIAKTYDEAKVCLERVRELVERGTYLTKPVDDAESLPLAVAEVTNNGLVPLSKLVTGSSISSVVFASHDLAGILHSSSLGAEVIEVPILNSEVVVVGIAPVREIEHTFIRSKSLNVVHLIERNYRLKTVDFPDTHMKMHYSPALGYRPEHLTDLLRFMLSVLKQVRRLVAHLIRDDPAKVFPKEALLEAGLVLTTIRDADLRYLEPKISAISKYVEKKEVILATANEVVDVVTDLKRYLSNDSVRQGFRKLRFLMRRDPETSKFSAIISLANIRGAISVAERIISLIKKYNT